MEASALGTAICPMCVPHLSEADIGAQPAGDRRLRMNEIVEGMAKFFGSLGHCSEAILGMVLIYAMLYCSSQGYLRMVPQQGFEECSAYPL